MLFEGMMERCVARVCAANEMCVWLAVVVRVLCALRESIRKLYFLLYFYTFSIFFFVI